jgi:hypothetical protein
MTKLLCAASAILIVTVSVVACSSYDGGAGSGSDFRSSMDAASGTPHPSTDFSPSMTPGAGPLDEGKRAGSHAGAP